MKGGFYGRSSVFLGALAAGISVVIVLGSLLLAFTEGGQSSSIASYPTIESVDINTPLPQETTPPPNTPTPTNTPTLESTNTPTGTATLSPIPSICNPPPGWEAYTIKQNDTLNKLAQSAGLSPQEVADANCLSESRLVPGSTLYLPPLSPTSTAAKCGAPPNWVVYTVQPGDTLYSIAQRVNRSVAQLITANCLSSDKIHTGQKLYVPYYPPQIPVPTSVPPTKEPPPLPSNTSLPPAAPTDSNISRNTPTP
ncbi:MAG: LysM peptidoglycan-binding domain-containing protein [Anaerolineales bacterium]